MPLPDPQLAQAAIGSSDPDVYRSLCELAAGEIPV